MGGRKIEKYLVDIFDRVRVEQKEKFSPICPRCGSFNMRSILVRNCLTRDNRIKVYICVSCGIDEAARDMKPDNQRCGNQNSARLTGNSDGNA